MTKFSATGPETDEELLSAWRAGDKEAGSALFDRHWRSVTRFFSTKAGPAGEDLVQQTFLACVESQHRYRGDARFRTYILSVARFVLLRHLRAQRREPQALDPEVMSIAESARSYTSVLFERQEHARLIAALQTLPIDTQATLELFYWEGLKMREIAIIMECPIGTIKARLSRGRLALAERLGPAKLEPRS